MIRNEGTIRHSKAPTTPLYYFSVHPLATILDENWCPVKVRGLNILGSDILRQLLPGIVAPFCVSSINTLKNTATD